MTIQTAIRKIKAGRPKDVRDFTKLGLPLDPPFEKGAFRVVHKIKGLDLVVKFPIFDLEELGDDKPPLRRGRLHSRVEIRRIKKLSRFKDLRPHLPKVYYYDPKSGIIVMQYYADDGGSWSAECSNKFTALMSLTTKLIYRKTGIRFTDLRGLNIRLTCKPYKPLRLIFIDLGY